MCSSISFTFFSLCLVLHYAVADRQGYVAIPEVENYLYKFHSTLKTWVEAKETCASEEASLFYPDTKSEANAIIDFFNGRVPFPGWFFIGLRKLGPVFRIINGTLITKEQTSITWLKGEPNVQGGSEDCVEMLRDFSDWSLKDHSCDGKQAFVCKKKILPKKFSNAACGINNIRYKYSRAVGKCYRIATTPKTWTEARDVCISEGSDLAVINSQQEANYLVEQISKTLMLRIPGTFVRGVVHLGFHNNHVEDWETIDGTSLYYSGYACWGSQQPDEDKCGSMLYNGHLNAIGCHQKALFICEHDSPDFVPKPLSGDILEHSITS